MYDALFNHVPEWLAGWLPFLWLHMGGDLRGQKGIRRGLGGKGMNACVVVAAS